MGRVRETTPTWDRARRPIDEFRARAEPLPVVQLEGGVGSSLLRTPFPLPANPEWFAIALNSIVARDDDIFGEVRSMAVPQYGIVGRAGTGSLGTIAAGSNSVFGRHGTGGSSFLAAGTDVIYGRFGAANVGFQQAVARRVLARGATGDLEWKSPAKFLAEVMDLATTGTVFPTTNLYDGRPFYRTDLHMSFHHDTGTTGWLGDEVMTLFGAEEASETSYMDLLPFLTRYDANNKGWGYPFDVKPVFMSGSVSGSSTCTYVVRSNGTNVTGAVLTWTAQTGKKSATFLGGTIPADNNISFAVNSGTAVVAGQPLMVHAGFRRFET